MAAKVEPSDVFVFKKEIPCNPPLKAFDETYTKRKQAVGEKFFTCKSERRFCYFTDGEGDPKQADVAVVLCLHGASASKYLWLMPEPLKGIFMVCVDRFGHGNSSSTPEDGYSFADGCAEFVELIDHVYAENNIPTEKKFFVAGHSMGATWTVSMASCPEVCDRIEAIAPINGPSDLRHPQYTKEELKQAYNVAGFMTGSKKKGCSGACNRWLFKTLVLNHCAPQKKGDYGMAAAYKQNRDYCLEGQGCKDLRGKDALDASPFFVTATVDVNRGHTTLADAMVEWQRCFGEAWSYDAANIKVPCFLYNGEKEIVDKIHSEFHHKVIKDSKLALWMGHSEVTIVVEFPRIIEALVKKQIVEEPSFGK